MENESSSSKATPQTPDGRNGAALSDGMLPPHRALAQRDFLTQFGAALTERVATASPPVYRGPTDAPWAPLRLLKRKPLGAQGLIANKIKSSLMVEGKLPGEGLSNFGADPSQQGGQGDLLLELARCVLADETGGAREVAGSLEATFRDLASVEQEQDHYIGEIETPVMDALDNDEEIVQDTVGAESRSTAAEVRPLSESPLSATAQQPPSLHSSPWEEWLKAHGVTTSPRSRHRRQSQTAAQRPDHADVGSLPKGSLWAAMERTENDSSDGRRTTSADPHPPSTAQPSTTEARSLWEQVE